MLFHLISEYLSFTVHVLVRQLYLSVISPLLQLHKLFQTHRYLLDMEEAAWYYTHVTPTSRTTAVTVLSSVSFLTSRILS